MDSTAALRSLVEAAGPVRSLQEYRSQAELDAAIGAVAAAVDRSLRLALRTDESAPAGHRLSALSIDALPLDQVVRSLRARDRVSMTTAGAVHELGAAAERARAGRATPEDADVATRAVKLLRSDLTTPSQEPAPARSAAATAGTAPPPKVRGRGRWMAWLGAGLAVFFMIGLSWVLAGGGQDDFEDGVAAFRAARWDSAAAAFERVLRDRPVDVLSMLYLGRVYRRQGRLNEASEVLREAVRVAPDDADVRREVGRLFMDLGQPESAIRQFEIALQHDPESVPTWTALIHALRAVGDPRAERMLDRAPPEVQAALRSQGS